MRIDSQQYFTAQHPPEHLRPILARNRFDGSIAILPGRGREGAVGTEPDPAPFLQEAASYDFIKGFVHPIDLTEAGWERRLDELQQSALFRGVRFRLADAVPRGLVELSRRGIPLDLELDASRLSVLPALAEAAPALRIALVDLGAPTFGQPVAEEWARGMEEAAALPQVFCKAGNLLRHAPSPWKAEHVRPFVQHALRVFGPRRLMFGSGWPASLPQFGWKESLAAFTQSIGAQTMETREELLGGTAARFYGLVAA